MLKLVRLLSVWAAACVPVAVGCGQSEGGSESVKGGPSGNSGNGIPRILDSIPPGATPVVHGADTHAPPPIVGGGSNSAPLGTGCGPETAGACHPVGGNCNPSTLAPDHRVLSAESVCFYAEAEEQPSALVEYVTEVQNAQEYVHLRVTFDPRFVDTVYGECAPQSGWSEVEEVQTDPGKKPKKPKGGHTFKDLLGSDHVELMLQDCGGETKMHLKLDFISEDATSGCGYKAGGVENGDGKILLGSPEHVLAAASSLDRNMNGCGYCEVENSPCPGEGYVGDPEAPEWDYRVVYEVWVDAAAFGGAGFCGVDIDAVHASPSKGEENTVTVEPEDCPPPPCPPSYQLYLTSEGEEVCVPVGDCPGGYEIDLTSEDLYCVETK